MLSLSKGPGLSVGSSVAAVDDVLDILEPCWGHELIHDSAPHSSLGDPRTIITHCDAYNYTSDLAALIWVGQLYCLNIASKV